MSNLLISKMSLQRIDLRELMDYNGMKDAPYDEDHWKAVITTETGSTYEVFPTNMDDKFYLVPQTSAKVPEGAYDSDPIVEVGRGWRYGYGREWVYESGAVFLAARHTSIVRSIERVQLHRKGEVGAHRD